MARRHLDKGWLGQYVSGAKRKVDKAKQKLEKATTGHSRGRYSLVDPANRGALTETMRRTGKTKYQLAHSKNPLTRKRARFAITAAKWNH